MKDWKKRLSELIKKTKAFIQSSRNEREKNDIVTLFEMMSNHLFEVQSAIRSLSGSDATIPTSRLAMYTNSVWISSCKDKKRNKNLTNILLQDLTNWISVLHAIGVEDYEMVDLIDIKKQIEKGIE